MAETRLVVLGVGNPDRGDDGAGRAVVAHLRERLEDGAKQPGIVLSEHGGEATSLVDLMADASSVVIVDAASSGAKPGTFRRFEASQGALPIGLSEMSSHGFGVAQAIELARALDTLPEPCIVYAIEGESFDAGAPLSPAVAHAAEAVAMAIIREFAFESSHA